MATKKKQQNADGNLRKDPDEWKTGDEPMTAAQRLTLRSRQGEGCAAWQRGYCFCSVFSVSSVVWTHARCITRKPNEAVQVMSTSPVSASMATRKRSGPEAAMSPAPSEV